MSQGARKPIAMVILIIWLTVYVIAVASLSGWLATAPRWAQLLFYIVAGVAWVIPLRPLFRWMNTG